MGTIINATDWKELKKQLRTLEGKTAFRMTRINSFHNGIFHRILHGFRFANCTYELEGIVEE